MSNRELDERVARAMGWTITLSDTADPWQEKFERYRTLRAYRDRTEAALREFTSELNRYADVPTNYYKQELRRLGLWREGGA